MDAVLHIINYCASYRGNFIESLEQLNSALRERDCRNIYLFCSEAKECDSKNWIDEMCSNGSMVEFLTNDSAENIGLIRNLIAAYNVKLVHTHFITMNQFRDANLAVPKHIPFVMHMHNHSKKSMFLKELARRFIYRRCIMVACSESVYRSLERDYSRNEKYYIDNGVRFERLDEWVPISATEYGVAEGEKVCLIFGFDFYRKGVDLALKALSNLREKGYKYSLLISLSTNFSYVEEQIRAILGDIPEWVKVIKARNDVASLYNYSDIFLSPSREEGLPYSVVEAGYCKCSVVMSDISAQVKLRLKYGYWFSDGNVSELEEAILTATQEHSQKIQNLEESKQYMREGYSLEEWSRKVIELYDKILARV